MDRESVPDRVNRETALKDIYGKHEKNPPETPETLNPLILNFFLGF